jgi:hypothetical protein
MPQKQVISILPNGVIVLKTKKPKACTVEGCSAPAFAKGLCKAHYFRMRRHGSTEKKFTSSPRVPFIEKAALDGGLLSGRFRYAVMGRVTLPEKSARSQARYAKAMRLMDILEYLGVAADFQALIDRSEHKSGRPNAAKLLRLVQELRDSSPEGAAWRSQHLRAGD